MPRDVGVIGAHRRETREMKTKQILVPALGLIQFPFFLLETLSISMTHFGLWEAHWDDRGWAQQEFSRSFIVNLSEAE